ncbi:MAG: CDP-glycerol glycerophosphotransferase family protein, partial [Candidatus Cloacimonetes bacterium]|nr:CDP-glycerol glycerophosphotransferase family protein [Candidatus Cloacimonadota bacterium]
AERPFILYAPSYRPTSIYKLATTIPALSRVGNVVVKLHPYSWNGKYVSHFQHIIFQYLQLRFPTIKLVPKCKVNILPYLAAAEVMISDGSSVINEYLALGKCGVIYNLNKKLAHHDGQPLMEEDTSKWLADSFEHIDHPRQLIDAVEKALHPNEIRLKQLIIDRDKVYAYTDGQAARRVKEVILETLT